MRVRQLARKDFDDAVRARHLHLVVLMFGLIGVLIGYIQTGAPALAAFLGLAFLVPIVAIAFTQQAIVGKRETHELSVLLGLPFSRLDVVIGTYLGRASLVVATVASTYLGVAVIAPLRGQTPDPGTVVVGFVLAGVVGLIFVSISLGISAATGSTTVASVGGFLTFFLFAFQLWTLIPDAVRYVVNGFELPSSDPTWALVFEQLSPYAAVRNVAVPVASDLADAFPIVGSAVPDDPPLYMEPPVAALVILVWLVLPVVLGYRSFQRTDL